MSESTGITLTGPQGIDEFLLKVNGEINIAIEKNIVTSTLSAASDTIVGQDITVARRTYTIQGTIANMDDSDYPKVDDYPPNAVNNPNPNHAYAYQLERAANQWGSIITGSSTLSWNRGGLNQEINGTITSFDSTIIPSADNNSDHYEYTLEFMEIDIQY